ncbi:hypothetical protein ACFQZR_17410 [Paenibacillus sp. GCM10027629]|uniref:hypothetical protein n=1 Tax=Paenibacillus sp. GCM10027629 TaxID=3273414 RepID=UPI0036328C78
MIRNPWYKSLALCFLLMALGMGMFMPPSYAAATIAQPNELQPVQQFELKSEKIVKVVPNNDAFQKEALSWLNSATGLSTQLSLDDKCGSIYKVPLKKEITKEFKGLTFVVSEIFLIYCPTKDPLILVFNKERKPFLLTFSADVKPFITMVDKAQ